MDINFRQLRAFVLAAETRSFTRTAEQLHLSQPSLSYVIRKLEDAVGVSLLTRNTRSVELTDAGAQFLPQARHLLRGLEDALREADAQRNLSRGRVRIAALPSAAAAFIPLKIAGFSGQYPGIQIDLRDGRAGEIRGWIMSGEVDVGLSSFPDDMAGLSFTPLFDDGLVLVRPHPKSGAPTNLNDQPYIALGTDTSIRPLADAALERLGYCLPPCWEVSYMSTAASLVRAGLGFALLPASCAETFNVNDGLVIEPLSVQAPRPIGLLRRKPERSSPAIERFLEWLRDPI
jgi:LysR family transcriptional regulator, carnitine catabolism transcriptional activator